MKRTSTIYQKISLLLPIIVLAFFVFVPDVSFGQTEEEILNSIGSELEDESAKEKQAEKVDKEYKALKSKADAAYKGRKFDKAKEYYTQMVKLKPDSDFAKSRLAIMDQKIAEEKEAAAQKKYDALISQADALLASEKWGDAAAKYKSASALLPDEAYPKDQIKKMAKLQAEAKAAAAAAVAQKKYDGYISKADAAKTSQNWTEAKKNYTLASNTKPEEAYPKQQLAVLDKLQKEAEEKAKQAALDKKYQTLIAGGDAALSAKKWADAKAKYKLAMDTKPSEAYAKAQYNKVDGLEKEYLAKQEQMRIDAEYKRQIQSADQLFNNQKWSESIVAYQAAKQLKPGETYSNTQITKAEGKIKETLDAEKKAEQLDSDFQKHKKTGEDALAKGNWLVAIESFTAAKVLKPQNTGVADLLNQAKSGKKTADDLALKQKAEAESAKKTQNQFDSEIAKGTQAMNDKNWDMAGAAFNKAKKLLSQSPIPDQKLAELSSLVDQENTEKLAAKEKLAEEKAAEKARLEEEARISAEKEEAEKARLLEEKRLAKEAAATAEAKRLADEAAEKAKLKEEKRLAEEKAASEAAKKAEEAKIAAEKAKLATAEKLAEEAAEKERQKQEAKLASEKAADEKAKLQAEAKLAAEAAALAKAEKIAEEKAEKERVAEENRIAEEKATAEETARIEAQKLVEEKELAEAEELNEKMEAEFNQALIDYQTEISSNNWEGAAAAISVADGLYPGDKKVSQMRSELSKLKAAEQKAIAEENTKAQKAAEKQKKYDGLVAKGDLAIGSSDFNKAKENFNAALKIFPQEEYPVTKLAEIKELELAANQEELARQQEIDANYSALMAKGESAMGLKNWVNAEESFREAQKLKPENAGPKERITEIKRLMQKEKDLAAQAAELEEDYNLRMVNGQKALDNKQFADAKRFFMGSFKLKPKEELPQEKLAETERLWARYLSEEKAAAEAKKTQELEDNYNGFILSGDKAFENQLWEEAIRGYQGALALKPREVYPKDRLEASKTSKEEANAEALKKQKEEAAKLKAAEEERLRLEAETAATMALEDKFSSMISQGDQAMQEENYGLAVSSFKKALELKPDNSEVMNKLADAQAKFKASEAIRLEKEKERKRLAAIELKKRQEEARVEREAYLAEIKKNSPEELAKNYPDGISEEAEIIEGTLITKSIIVEKGAGRYLLKFDYPWGEHFYYLNGKKVREDTYNWNIRKYKF